MKISLELFLADNLTMNFLVLRLAAAFLGERKRTLWLLLAGLGGAVYGALSLSVLPVLGRPLLRLLLSCCMALPLAGSRREYPKALLCLLLSACLMGGLMLGLALVSGGSFDGGAYVCTVPVRVALWTVFAGALLPRAAQAMVQALRARSLKTRLRLTLDGRVLTISALLDSGNLLTEPITGLPVIVLRPGLVQLEGGLPVPFHSVGGSGVLLAHKPEKAELYLGEWREVHALVAIGKEPISAGDAIVGTGLISEERWKDHEETQGNAPAPVPEAPDAPGGDSLYSHGGNASAALWAGGGEEMDREAHERG